jgi:hypothetical protein
MPSIFELLGWKTAQCFIRAPRYIKTAQQGGCQDGMEYPKMIDRKQTVRGTCKKI